MRQNRSESQEAGKVDRVDTVLDPLVEKLMILVNEGRSIEELERAVTEEASRQKLSMKQSYELMLQLMEKVFSTYIPHHKLDLAQIRKYLKKGGIFIFIANILYRHTMKAIAPHYEHAVAGFRSERMVREEDEKEQNKEKPKDLSSWQRFGLGLRKLLEGPPKLNEELLANQMLELAEQGKTVRQIAEMTQQRLIDLGQDSLRAEATLKERTIGLMLILFKKVQQRLGAEYNEYIEYDKLRSTLKEHEARPGEIFYEIYLADLEKIMNPELKKLRELEQRQVTAVRKLEEKSLGEHSQLTSGKVDEDYSRSS